MRQIVIGKSLELVIILYSLDDCAKLTETFSADLLLKTDKHASNRGLLSKIY